MKNFDNQSKAAVLRQKAEELLKMKSSKTSLQLSEAEALKLMHEYEVHQIELELQNEELMLARSAAQDAAIKYTELYDFAPSGYFTLSKEGKIIDLNLCGSQMLGRERSHLKNISFSFFVSNDTKFIFNHFLERIFNSIVKESCELTLSAFSNSPIYIYLTGITNKNGEECLVNAVDTTKRKQAEVLLKQSESRYRLLADHMSDLVWLMDMNLKMTYISPSIEQLVGYTLEELREPLPLNQILTPASFQLAMETFLEEMEKVTSDPTYSFSHILEVEFYRKDGTSFWSESTFSLICDENGKPTSILGEGRDISRRKQAEQDLIQAKEKAIESDRLKSAFLANMSHEIRTPMNGILGFARLLKAPTLTRIEEQAYISIIEKSGIRLLNIINDIISISKIESGQMNVYISDTDINEHIEFIYDFFQPEVKQKGIQLFYKNPLRTEEVIIKSDSEKIYAVLTNLVKNAIKFTSKGSIEIGYEKKGKYLEFFVKDTGTGIRHDQKEIIFGRFRQGNDSLTRNYEGSGLGLSISKAYVEMLGGKIWVESEVGKGSVFYFTLPYKVGMYEESVNLDADSGDTDDTQLEDLKIMIVEDDKTSEMLISKMIEPYGKEILYAKNGVEAVEACLYNPDIDLILMDIKMPKMDGHEAARQIRQFNKEVIIIVQSAFALSGEREKALEAGCNDYISKPFKQALLAELIKKQLKNQENE